MTKISPECGGNRGSFSWGGVEIVAELRNEMTVVRDAFDEHTQQAGGNVPRQQNPVTTAAAARPCNG